jgi:hypothetical protein
MKILILINIHKKRYITHDASENNGDVLHVKCVCANVCHEIDTVDLYWHHIPT